MLNLPIHITLSYFHQIYYVLNGDGVKTLLIKKIDTFVLYNRKHCTITKRLVGNLFL